MAVQKLDRMQTVEINGRLQGDMEQPALHDLDAFVETADSLQLRLGGSAMLQGAG